MAELFDSVGTAIANVGPVPVPQSAPSPLLIYQRAAEANVSPELLREMAALCERWEANRAADAYGAAVAKFQSLCPQIQKKRSIDLGGGKGPVYATLDDIMAVIKPHLAECALSVTFTADLTDAGQLRATCIVRHGRYTEESSVTMPVPSQMRVNDTQKMGAALSYAKRYALCAALNIVVSDEDRDGHGLCDTLCEADIATLREWIVTTNSDEAKYLKALGAQSLASIPQRDFAKALQMLKDKAAKQR